MSSNGHTNGDGHASRNGNGEVALRLPPQNIEAEESVLASILVDNRVTNDVREEVTAADFFRDKHQSLFRIMCGLIDQGKPADLITVADELRRLNLLDAFGGVDWLSELVMSIPHAANARYHAQLVRQKAIGREAILLAEDLSAAAYRQDVPAADLLAKMGDRFSRIEVIPEDEPDVPLIRPWPAPAEPAAFHGVAGAVVQLIAPHSETDPHAILGQLLVAWGNLIGRRPHWKVERTIHHTNLFVCLVGMSSKARKGTSWEHVKWLMRACDPNWANHRILSGMASGEGFIWNVRDPVVQRVKQKSGAFKGMYEEEEVDPGERDKRAMWVEPEFGSTLSIMNRDGNSLSGKVRDAFDTGDIRSATKNSPLRATGTHASLIGHVTDNELRLRLTRNDSGNGFGNRFLWLAARRSRFLPHGGRIQDETFTDVVRDLRHATENSHLGVYDYPIERDVEADELWEEVYPELSSVKPGLLGEVTSRAEALTMRLACLYALLDRETYIGRVHLEAGLAFWRYCERSAAYIFGDSLGDPDAEKLLRAIVAAGASGLTIYQIRRQVFKGHKTAAQTSVLLDILSRAGLAEPVTAETPQRGGTIAVSWKTSAPGKMP